MKDQFFDAQAAMGFVVSQTSHIEAGVYEIQYPDIQYPGLVPVDTSANPLAKSVTYFSSDKFGKAAWINGNSDDVPMAGSESSKHETAVYSAGIGYGYGWEEIQQAQMLGVNLSSDDAVAARRAYEEMVDEVALVGDSAKGFQGLFNNSSVTASNATNGDWGTATPDEMLADINDALIAVQTGTNTVVMADTLLLPFSKFNLLSSTRLTDTAMTILEFLRQNNVYTATTGQPLTIRAMRGLDTAGAASATRMVAYRRSPDVLKMHIPMPHRFMPAYQAGPLRYEVPGVFRIGGLDIRQPKAVVYSDAI